MYDVIVALSSALSSNGELSETATNRVAEAVRRYNSHLSPNLLFCGASSYRSDRSAVMSEASVMKQRAIALGVSPKTIYVEERSRETLGNAYFCKVDFLRPHNWSKALIITSDYHLERVRYVFSKICGHNFDLSFYGCATSLAPLELQKRQLWETKALKVSREWLEPLKDDDDMAVKKVFFDNGPGYNPNAKYTRESLIKYIESQTV